MASSSAAADARQSSTAPLHPRSDVLYILRRSSAIFFSTSVVGPLLLSVASFLVLLSRSLIFHLTFQCTASLMKNYDSVTCLTFFLLLGYAFYGYFILATALLLTALLTVLSSLLNRPQPTAGSYMGTIRNHGLFVFHKTLVLGPLGQSASLSITYVLAGAGGEMRHGLPPFPMVDDMISQYPVPLIAACCVLVSMVSVVVFHLAPCAQLFLSLADERRMGAWHAVKQGCFMTFVKRRPSRWCRTWLPTC